MKKLAKETLDKEDSLLGDEIPLSYYALLVKRIRKLRREILFFFLFFYFFFSLSFIAYFFFSSYTKFSTTRIRKKVKSITMACRKTVMPDTLPFKK